MIDAHLHLCDDALYKDAPAIIIEAQKHLVQEFLNVVTNKEELDRAFILKKQFPFLKIAASTTPHEAESLNDPFFEEVARCAKSKLIDAIGETGLEYFHPGLDRQRQREYLRNYLKLAIDTDLPLVFHCRDGFDDLFKELEPFKGKLRGMVHCFTGSYEEAIKAIELGFMISISGIVTFRNSLALQTAVSKLPLSSILIETDSPYLAPLSQRGKTNKPAFIKETYQKVAQLKNMSVQELERHVANNFFKIF
jgi:TatD DNase family protein